MESHAHLSEIDRITMVKTSAWLLSRGEVPAFPTADLPTRSTEDQLPVRRFLEAITKPGLAGEAWLCDIGGCAGGTPRYVGPEAHQALVDSLDNRIAEVWRQSRPDDPPWDRRSSTTAPMTDGPGQEPSLLRRWRRGDEAAELRHRAFLDAERFRAVVSECEEAATLAEPDLPFYVVLELRFFHLLGQLRCHVSMSVWSAVPGASEHRPDEVYDESPPPQIRDVDKYKRLFESVADAAEHMLRAHGFVPVDSAVGDAVQGLPVFWVVTPRNRRRDPMDYLVDDSTLKLLTNHLARVFLEVGDVRDTEVSHSVLNGRLFTLRRPQSREDGSAVPRYLVIPGYVPTSRDDITPRQLESDAAVIVTTLTDLEAASASRLMAAKFDLEIWRKHLEIYNEVAERAGFLWDALSAHLPIRRGFKLGRAHRAVELLHQMLLQGVADLAFIAAEIAEDQAKVTEVADDVSDQFRARITERPSSGQPGLVTALTKTGLSGYVQREASEIATAADRVKTAYNDLLQAIASAFDERRVREFDVLQRFNFLLGTVLGAVGLVTVLDATMQMKPPDGGPLTLFGGPSWLAPVAVVFSWLLGVVLIVVAVLVLARTAQLGRLGSPQFRALYDGWQARWRRAARRLWELLPGWFQNRFRVVWSDPPPALWRVLRDISTDTLERTAKQPDTPPSTWQRLDITLAQSFAAVWDEIAKLKPPTRADRSGRDIKALSRQIEQWGLHALLLSERPRRMYRYPLPVLTCLFRAVERVEGPFLGATYLSRTNLVAYEDFSRSLARCGFSGAEIRQIDDWLTRPRYPSARAAYERIRELGLRVPMSDDARARALNTVIKNPSSCGSPGTRTATTDR